MYSCIHARLKVKHFSETLRNSHFVQIKKVGGARVGGGFDPGRGWGGLDYLGWGKAARRVMDIPQDEVGHCSLSPVKRAL